MTALAIPVSSAPDLSSSTFPSISTIAETTALGALDTAGRVVGTIERGIDLATQTVNVTIPAVSRFVGGFFLPAHGNAILGSVFDYATPTLTGLIAGGAKATAQTLSFGAPAWIETLREGYGVSTVAGQLNHGDTSREFLARCFAENTSEPLIKDSLLGYLDLRKQLSALQQHPSESSQDQITELSRSIARFEIKLRDYQDFNSLKLILERGEEFIGEQHKRINQLAHETAGNIVQRVEQFYQDKCGTYAGKIEGSWSTADTEEKRAALRSELTEKIALRLQNVFDKEMSAGETISQLNRVAVDLHSSFGTYRNALRSTLYTVLGVGYASGAFRYLADAAGSALWDMAGGVIDGVKEGFLTTARTIHDYVSSGLSSCYNYFYTLFAEATNRIIENNPVIAAIRKSSEAVFENASDTINEAVTSVFGDSSSPDYSHPYWSGTNQVLMGYDSDGTPLYGANCISGLPSRPRFAPDLSSFGETLGEPGSLTELLKPRERVAPNSEEMKKLVEFLLEKN